MGKLGTRNEAKARRGYYVGPATSTELLSPLSASVEAKDHLDGKSRYPCGGRRGHEKFANWMKHPPSFCSRDRQTGKIGTKSEGSKYLARGQNDTGLDIKFY